MPNGKPGDHPINDIVQHRLHLFGGGVDEEIFRIAAEFGEGGLQKLKAFSTTTTFIEQTKAIQEQQRVLLDSLADVWNELIIERRRVAANQI
ncbi:hypothetical protein [Microvirga aerophila]|uniref:Uncharacterized protein n=1 Tax=Microvirga aerophila TaxID=670291 RepID=A0A512BKQ2_9HYPH|nr:hypothetical protein [Microvirga aerophila]GEO12556.1 hypothetical protein MAE02_02520 [Microvirga aerophila]